MSDYARNLDTFGDGDDGPMWIPQVGERVEVKHSAITSTGAPNNLRYFGRVEECWYEEYDQDNAELEFSILMDNNPFGDRPWYVCAALEELYDVIEEAK